MTQTKRCLLLAITVALVLFAAACSGSTPSDDSAAKPPGDRFPDNWDDAALEALVANLDVIKTVQNDIDIHVLQWKVEENDQPQRIESALVWAKFTAGESEDWMLAHVIRDATSGDSAAPWSLAVFQGTPQVSHQYYEQAPTVDDVTRFLRASWWSDDASSGNRLSDSATRSQAWTAAVGGLP